jgi:hypothetical protein
VAVAVALGMKVLIMVKMEVQAVEVLATLSMEI